MQAQDPNPSVRHLPDNGTLIDQWCERLGDAFGRKVNPRLAAIWRENLVKFPQATLQRAFHQIERGDEKFPTVSRVLRVCADNLPPNTEAFQFRRAVAKDPETGRSVNILVDENGEMLFRAADCPEGREFLAALVGPPTNRRVRNLEPRSR